MTTQKSFSCKNPSEAITCGQDIGPYFGDIELSAYYEPLNQTNACSSYANNSGYNIP